MAVSRSAILFIILRGNHGILKRTRFLLMRLVVQKSLNDHWVLCSIRNCWNISKSFHPESGNWMKRKFVLCGVMIFLRIQSRRSSRIRSSRMHSISSCSSRTGSMIVISSYMGFHMMNDRSFLKPESISTKSRKSLDCHIFMRNVRNP